MNKETITPQPLAKKLILRHSSKRILIGFDGFIDTLVHCVLQRKGPGKYVRASTISHFAEKIKNAAGHSTNIELVVQEQSIGGNAPLMAKALAHLGLPSRLLGACGYPAVDPLFLSLEKIGVTITSYANPGQTDAVEFSDGKIMLGKIGELNHLSFEDFIKRCRLDFSKEIETSDIIATVNWTMVPIVQQFWEYLIKHPSLLRHRPYIFVDIADPAKRSSKDLRHALRLLQALQQLCPVILGLNQSESHFVLSALKKPLSRSLSKNAKTIIERLKLDSVIIHSHKEATVAYHKENKLLLHSEKRRPTRNPVRSTGAGDTFNAGFLFGLATELSQEQCLQNAMETASRFVMTGIIHARG